jgi:hypothetical protein
MDNKERLKQTPQAIATMRQLWPMMVDLLKKPHFQQQLRIQAQVVNWDVINDVERQCGLPLTPCPDSDVTKHLGLDDETTDGFAPEGTSKLYPPKS